MRHVAACVAGTEQPLVDGRQGAAVLAVALAALRSSGEGRQINLNEHELGEGAKWLTSLGRR
jgi:predicted dehydrogenase